MAFFITLAVFYSIGLWYSKLEKFPFEKGNFFLEVVYLGNTKTKNFTQILKIKAELLTKYPPKSYQKTAFIEKSGQVQNMFLLLLFGSILSPKNA
jgi:uncharacterized membrane protein YiaA